MYMGNEHYVDNKKFYSEMVDLTNKRQLGEECEINEYIGKCFLDIAVGLSNRPNFINYTFKDDMIFDGVENCVRYCYNFDPTKSKNPFSYFTQIIYYAFLRRIEKEKKQSYIKYKMSETVDINDLLKSDSDVNIDKGYNIYQHEFSNFETFEDKKNSRKKKKGKLEEFMV